MATETNTFNDSRVLTKLVRELAREHGATVQALGAGWILRVTRGGTTRSVHGYTFDLNGAATHAIACDKAATSDVLGAAGVPRVEHRLFLHPEMARYVRHPGNWTGMAQAFEAWGRDVVVKDNAGTGGRGVYRARSAVELEHAVLKLFERGHAAAVSPFVRIEDEVRFVLLAGKCEVVYSKQRPTVVGDGTRTVLELVAAGVAREGVTAEIGRWLANLEPEAAAVLSEVPGRGEERLLNWRHNLGQGASVKLMRAEDPSLRDRLELALAAGRALNLTFGSVDVVTVDGRPHVLEVNSGVMMEALAGVPGGLELAKSVYARAFSLMMGEAR